MAVLHILCIVADHDTLSAVTPIAFKIRASLLDILTFFLYALLATDLQVVIKETSASTRRRPVPPPTTTLNEARSRRDEPQHHIHQIEPQRHFHPRHRRC